MSAEPDTDTDATRAAAIDRRALRSVAVQFFANGMIYATIVPRLPDIRDRVGISIGTLGLVLTLGSVAGFVASLLTARVIPRFGSRRVMIYGASVQLVALPTIGFATDPVVLVVGLMAWLFLDVFVDVAMNVQGSALSARRHTPVMNRLHGLWSLGTVSGGLLSVVLLRGGVSATVQLTAVAVVLMVALALVAPGLLHRDEAPELVEAAGAVAAHPPRSRRRVAGLVLAVAGATAMAIEMTNADWATFHLRDDLDAGPGIAALGFVLFTVGMTSGRFGGDFVQVRIGATQLVRFATVVIAVGTVLATLVPVTAVSIVGFLIAGLGTSVLFPQLYDRAARASDPPGSGFAAMLLGQRGAAVAMPAIVGALADTSALTVGQAMAIVVLPCLAIAAAVTFVRL